MFHLTYGRLPSREQFDAHFERICRNRRFDFVNDERLGSQSVNGAALWKQLLLALADYEAGDKKAGTWCSEVLGCLDFKWVSG